MAKKQWRTLALLLAVFALGSLLLVACSRPGTASSSNNSGTASSSSSSSGSCPSGTTVKTSTSNFEQSCITLTKGDTLKLVQDQTSFHQFNYGQWNGTTQDPQPAPPGGPKVDGLQLSGPSLDIGPFTTAGTYHIYCTVHPGMNLTVIVK
jgi:plastocyanin